MFVGAYFANARGFSKVVSRKFDDLTVYGICVEYVSNFDQMVKCVSDIFLYV